MKLRLMLESGTLAGRVFELETGFLTVGRGETCSVRFDPNTERIASKQHAFIEARADGFYLTDNNSTNGTIVNGQSVSTTKLAPGDRVQFGREGIRSSVQIIENAAIPQQSYANYEAQQYDQMVAQQPVNLQASLNNFALGSASAVKVEPPRTGKYIGVVLTLIAILVLSIIVGVLMLFSLEGRLDIALIATVVAFVPALIYLIPILWLDRYDPEPIWLVSLAFAWGALVAVIVSFIINTFFGVAVGIAVSPEAGEAVGAVMSAPIFEEASKGIGLLVLLIFFRRYFDDVLDGIVFAGVIALGFATVENVLYYGRALKEAGMDGLLLLFVLRGMMSPFAHVTFTSMTGIGCGIARESHNSFVKIAMPVLGYIGAVILHAIWNGMAVVGGTEGFLYGYFLGEIPLFLIFVGFSLYVMRRQNKILNEMLAIDIARGLIPAEHVEKATSAFRSSAWLLGGVFEGKFKARSRYIRAIGKLGLSYWHIQRATVAQGQTGSFQQNPILRDEVLKWRDKV
ncbi:MAG: PrsW family glutamic-type intramembrane protease [Pyrinomonadaceae bacterium]